MHGVETMPESSHSQLGSRPISISIPRRSYTEPLIDSASQNQGLHDEELAEREEAITPLRAFVVRVLALLCACSLSVGSH